MNSTRGPLATQKVHPKHIPKIDRKPQLASNLSSVPCFNS